MIFALGTPEYAIPLSIEDSREGVYAIPESADPFVGILRRLSHAAKLREAKRYLWRRGLDRTFKWAGEK